MNIFEIKSCDKCLNEFGVRCTKPFLSPYAHIYLDGRFVLRTSEEISDCPVVIDKYTAKEVTEKIRENVKKYEDRFTINF